MSGLNGPLLAPSEQKDTTLEPASCNDSKRAFHKVGQTCCSAFLMVRSYILDILRKCIVVDMTFKYVWSNLLYAACFVEVTRTLAETELAQVFGQFDGGGTCRANSAMNHCNRHGTLFQKTNFEVTIDPIDEQKVSLNPRAIFALLVIVCLCLANSRYFAKMWRIPTLLLYLLAFQGLFHLCAYQIQDIFSCRASRLAWSDFENPPPHQFDSNVTSISTSFDIARSCSVSALFGGSALANVNMWLPYKMVMNAYHSQLNKNNKGPSLDVKDSMAGYMPHVTFLWAPSEFCNKFPNLRILGISLKSCEELVQQHFASKDGKLVVPGRAMMLTYLGSYDLGQMAEELSDGLLSYHILELAQHGIGCNPFGAGKLFPAQEYSYGCTYASVLLETDDSNNLVVKDAARPYLNLDFIKCTVTASRSCATKAYIRYRAVFRSVCGLFSCLFLVAGFVRLCYNRLSYQWPSLFQRSSGRQPSASRATADLVRLIFGSRICLGLYICFLLQTSVTITLVSMVWPLRESIQSFASATLNFPTAEFAFNSIIGVLILQWTICVGVGVVYNLQDYVKLRRQLWELSKEQFYGEAPAPEGWHGPDLCDFREMGSSSVLYATYFTGFVFWRFLAASMLMALFVEFVIVSLWFIWMCSHKEYELGAVRKHQAENVWDAWIYILFAYAILMVHYFTRLWITQCLLRQNENGSYGMRTRCHCLFTYCQLFTCVLAMAVGPFSAILDFAKGALCSLLAMLIIAKPNFTQFGELCDYVYCTYCAELYLERVEHDQRLKSQQSIDELLQSSEDEIEMSGKAISGISQDGDYIHILAYDRRPDLGGHQTFRRHGPLFCIGLIVILLGLPCLASILLDYLSLWFEYPCPCVLKFHFLPKVCDGQCADDSTSHLERATAAAKKHFLEYLLKLKFVPED